MYGVELGRLITAMVTPFNDDMSVNYDEAKRLALHVVETGSDGVLVAGTTGESPTLTDEEKIKLFEAVKEALGDKAKVIAGTGNYCTSESVELTKRAEEVGVDAVLLVCPYYNRPSQEGLYRHFRTVAEATSLPVILYNIPSRTGRNIEPETVIRLANDVPNIVGIKEASGDMKQVARICAEAPDKFAVWSGNDEDTIHILALGGVGVISVASHIVGGDLKRMIESFQSGDVATAREIHLNLMPFIRALFPPTSSNPSPIKAALNMLGFKVGPPRLPLVEVTDRERDELKRQLVRLGILSA
ncbi:MAG: 4-hydroxy-tetrahydrodipicolinate synthase [Armatimonadota bacterium]|nr:4-hydroxy-tetrahydrodipicolinate synthase [Armatimonadota bacterium]MCX7776714.1 4-hydroxy-tetrahydrodipicolinate synthase [Armatimonadota bacterium]MDW8025783.1 4-hydroxy-tetrahydrodipicolinate synthase [Armatimonadota bacterium]